MGWAPSARTLLGNRKLMQHYGHPWANLWIGLCTGITHRKYTTRPVMLTQIAPLLYGCGMAQNTRSRTPLTTPSRKCGTKTIPSSTWCTLWMWLAWWWWLWFRLPTQAPPSSLTIILMLTAPPPTMMCMGCILLFCVMMLSKSGTVLPLCFYS